MSGYWDGNPETEETPMMQPVKMELAPHARLGRRVNAVFTMMILLVFHTSLIVAGLLNWDVPCEFSLSRFLVIYGCCGLFFVYLLLREWLYFARLGSWPSSFTFLLMCLIYAASIGSGVLLMMYTFRARDTCRISAPLLYRWCFAAALFCALLILLCLLVPIVRCIARCCCAPVALCCIGCVETVGMDVDVGLVGGGPGGADGGPPGAPSGPGGKGKGGPGLRKAVQQQFIPAAAMLLATALCAPCLLLYSIICAPVCRPCSVLLYKLFELCGCVTILPDGTLEFRNCCGEATCGWFVRHISQCLLAPGMTLPGRSIVATFTNYAALIWFWCYLLFEVYWNWGLMCEAATPDAASDLSDSWKWFEVLAPSPVHWLLLLLGVCGLVFTLLKFMVDMFAYPDPPPRSAYEVHKVKMRRQVRVCINVLLFALFCVWGGFLFYFTETQMGCAASSPSIWRLALLLRLVFLVVVTFALLLLALVILECCISGRCRLVLLLSDDPLRGSAYSAGGASDGIAVGPLPPGAPVYSSRRHNAPTYGGPSAGVDGEPAAQSKFFVGATRDAPGAYVSEAPELDATTTHYTKGDPSARLLAEQVV